MVRKLRKMLTREKKNFIISFIASFFYAVCALTSPLIIRFIIDYVLSDTGESSNAFYDMIFSSFGDVEYLKNNIWICSVIIIGIESFKGLGSFMKNRYAAIGAENIAKWLKDSLYDHLQKLPYDYHVKAQTGDLVQRCTSDVDTIRRFLASQFMEIFRIIFVSGIAFIILLGFSVKLALVSVMIVPVIFFASYYFLGAIRRSFKIADDKEGELSTTMQENFTGVRVVRAFGREIYELEKFKVKNEEFKSLIYKTLHNLAIYWGSSDLLCFTQITAVIVTGAFMVYKGEISLGTLFVFSTYVNNLVWPLRQLGRILSEMGKMEVSYDRIQEVLNTPAEAENPKAVKHDLKGDIVFENVSFEYEKGTPVLKSISFHVKAGEKIALLGSTGSGKSSLMHIFLRLYDYGKGSVKINGIELRSILKSHLRERIGIVLQEPFLYSKSIMNNIKMAKDEVSEEEVYEATKTANVHNVIEDFKEGYDTLVGERGVTLSGGQKQRVAIARTLVKNSDILIFDDSLSAVDTETDALIQEELAKKSAGVTTFIISQRITTLMSADRIFVMENGKITDSGTHEELISRDGLYYRIWNIQNTMEEEFEKEV